MRIIDRRPATLRPRAQALSAARLPLTSLVIAVALGACADGTTGGLLGPEYVAISTAGSSGTPGGTTGNALLGRWTRLEGGGASEVSFAFASDGSGARTTVQRTALGGVIASDVQPFRWSAGGGVLVLQLDAPGAVAARQVVRATFRVEQALTGTTLLLDGVPYGRAGG
jgi:hypothetical protein